MRQSQFNFLFNDEYKRFSFQQMYELALFDNKHEQSDYFIGNNIQKNSFRKIFDIQKINLIIPPRSIAEGSVFAQDFAQELQQLKQLNELELSICESNPQKLQILYGNPIGDKGAQSIGKCLKSLVNLSELSLYLYDQEKIESKGLICMSDGISVLKQLKFLQIKIGNKQQVEPAGWCSLGDAIGQLNNLEFFELDIKSNNQVTFIGAEGIANGLKKLFNINAPRLIFGSNNNINEDGCSKLGECLNGKEKLVDLSLIISQRNKIGKEGAIKVAENLASLCNLTILNLFIGEENDVQIDRVQQLYSSISCLKKLKNLKFAIGNENKINSDQYFQQVSLLKNLRQLESLQLYFGQRNNSQLTIYQELMKILPELSILKQLDLHFSEQNKFGGIKIKQLDFSQLSQCQSLNEFSLYVGYQNILNEEVVYYLSEGIKHLTNLQILRVSLIFIKKYELKPKLGKLFNAISNLTQLTQLYLNFGQLYFFQHDDFQKFAQCLQNLTFLNKLYLKYENQQDPIKSYTLLNQSLKSCKNLKSITIILTSSYIGIINVQDFTLIFKDLKNLVNLKIEINKNNYYSIITGLSMEQGEYLCQGLVTLSNLHILKFNLVKSHFVMKMMMYFLRRKLKKLVYIKI
ncbi:hypothetical protein ABPG72_021835 [Tetrahymena utriculariae]